MFYQVVQDFVLNVLNPSDQTASFDMFGRLPLFISAVGSVDPLFSNPAVEAYKRIK